MYIQTDELVRGYRERMRRLALMDPLIDLDRKRPVHDKQGKRIDLLGLGLLTLLFFFDRRLSREYKTGIKEVIQFLTKVTKDTYILEGDQLEKIARNLIDNFRPATGVKRSLAFYDWETREQGSIEYSILKDNDFDAKTNTQYYTLDEDGLELIFSTKEFYSEFQISINQMLLRQQIIKKEFDGALVQIREMEIAVDSLKERMEKIRLEILRSIVSEETFERYKNLLEDTYARLEREDDEFKALKEFIAETRDTFYSGDVLQKEKNSYGKLIQITKELEGVHYDHGKLLSLTADLKNTALTTAQESLYYTGIQSFNFDMDVVSKILSTPLPPEVMQGMTRPFLKVEENPTWSPMTVFAEQNIIDNQEEREETGFQEVGENEEDDLYRKWLGKKYRQLMEDFLDVYEKEGIRTLAELMQLLENKESDLLEKRYFYSFWMTLHQRSPVTNEVTEETEHQMITEEALQLLDGRQLVVEELGEILSFHPKYSIQNMSLKMEGRES